MNRPTIAGGLKAEQNAGLRHLLVELLENNEPEAILGSLKRIAERRAHSVTRGKIELEESRRWLALAESIDEVQLAMRRRHVEGRQHDR
jgi:hypothetical protein